MLKILFLIPDHFMTLCPILMYNNRIVTAFIISETAIFTLRMKIHQE